jgi:crotonobetaine/carnitine-CoA ligase
MSAGKAIDGRTDDDIVFRNVIERRAHEHPDRLFAAFMGTDVRWTWRDLDRHANCAANALHTLGVAAGHAVALMSANSPAFLQTFFGVTKLGGLITPVNTAYRGNMLRHVLSLSDARVLVCESEFLSRFEELADDLGLAHVFVIGAFREADYPRLAAKARVRPFSVLVADGDTEPPPVPGPRFWDAYGIIFTSGTTGPSKGVLACYAQLQAMVKNSSVVHARKEDVFLIDLPLYHVSALLSLNTILQVGAAAAVGPRIQMAGYWERVHDYGVTHVTLLQQLVTWLWDQPPSAADRDHTPLRMLIGKYPPDLEAWCARFGVENTYSYFNMTEISSPLVHGLNPANRLASGRPRPGVTLRLVDEHDIEVPDGQPGEMLIRTDLPWEMNLGYVKMPEATARAWRNGWFHTGDMFRRDAEGYYYYADRVKDAIRRRGENISSFEVEEAIGAHPAILECAAVAARPPGASDDEVLAFVVLRPAATLSPADLIEFLKPRLTYFMIPRFIEFIDALPRNQSTRILKRKLRERGLGLETWDRDKAGIVVSGKTDRQDPRR